MSGMPARRHVHAVDVGAVAPDLELDAVVLSRVTDLAQARGDARLL